MAESYEYYAKRGQSKVILAPPVIQYFMNKVLMKHSNDNYPNTIWQSYPQQMWLLLTPRAPVAETITMKKGGIAKTIGKCLLVKDIYKTAWSKYLSLD